MIQYKAKRINDGKPVAGWYVHAMGRDGKEEHIIIEDMTDHNGCGEFWWMDVHEVDPATLGAVNDMTVFCKQCRHGKHGFTKKMGEFVECQKCRPDDTHRIKDEYDYCSQGVRRDEDDG